MKGDIASLIAIAGLATMLISWLVAESAGPTPEEDDDPSWKVMENAERGWKAGVTVLGISVVLYFASQREGEDSSVD